MNSDSMLDHRQFVVGPRPEAPKILIARCLPACRFGIIVEGPGGTPSPVSPKGMVRQWSADHSIVALQYFHLHSLIPLARVSVFLWRTIAGPGLNSAEFLGKRAGHRDHLLDHADQSRTGGL